MSRNLREIRSAVVKHGLVLALVVLGYAHVCIPVSGEPSADSPRHEVSAPKWPFQACLKITILRDKIAPRGITVADIASAVKDTKWKSLKELETLSVRSGFGAAVKLPDIAKLDVVLTGQGTAVAKKLASEGYAIYSARMSVEVDENRLKEMGIDAAAVDTAIDRVSSAKKFTMKDVRDLTIRGKNGSDVRLGTMARINVVFDREATPPIAGAEHEWP